MAYGRFIYEDVTLRKRNHLPHLDAARGLYFLTFCLKDALGPEFLSQLESHRNELIRKVEERFGRFRYEDRIALEREIRREIQLELDRGRGECVLGDSRNAEIVAEALRFYHGSRYKLLNDSVMPNHVHVSMESFAGIPWQQAIGRVKSYSAREINKRLGRSGSIWQDEAYDRLIRNDRHLERVLDYIRGNPAQVGRSGWPWYAEFPS